MTPPQRNSEDRTVAALLGPDIIALLDESPADIAAETEEMHPADLADVAELLDRDNVCIRAGHHCAMPLMRRLGVPATARASFGPYNTRADVDALVASLARAPPSPRPG